ncbi:MAG: DUF1553 domain-containing protein, partial [Planctomycetaceae bacterium]|nr:DUF1553 domain-containing protein [Planctomycetaceae bacterium]
PIPRSPEHQRHLEEFEAEQKRLNAEIENVSKQLKRLEAKLPKTVIDDSEATFVGEWTPSTSIKGFVGQGYQHSNNPDHVATFTTKLDRGNYKVQVAYTAASNRATKANVTLKSGENEAQRSIDQRKTPPIDGSYLDLGTFSLDGETTVSIRPTEQLATIVDAVRFVRLPDDMQKGDEIAEKLSATTQHLLELRRQLDELEKRKPAAPETVIAVAEQPDPGDTHLCIRGDHKHLGEIVPRGFLSVVETEPVAIPSDQSGRLELAQWIASPDNPLTARVLVNRVWSHLFGEGLVRTVDNFGVPGEAPSHPRLLDHLATEFINDEWSIKRLIRRIVLSRTYQLESAPRTAAPEDPENRLLTHQRRRRLDAECLHDAMLRVSGELLGDGRGNTVRSGTNSEYGYEFEYGQRAVYHPIFRNRIPEILTAFDFADPNMPIGKRTPTTLSTQALLMMNSPFVEDRVTAATDQILRERDSDQDRLEWLSASCFGRPLTSDERQLIERFLDSTSAEDPTQAWEMVVRAMFGSVAFRYLD